MAMYTTTIIFAPLEFPSDGYEYGIGFGNGQQDRVFISFDATWK
jgi:hypothetical protein